jgi:type VI secretion system protein ImpA
LYPLLDVEDNNDPTQRLSLLSALTAAPGSVFSGWLKIGDYLYLAPACQPKGLPPVTFEQLAAARQKAAGEGAAADAPDPAQLAAAIRNAGTEQVLACQQALQQAREAVQGIDHFLTTTLGSGGTISFEGLEKSLADMLGLIAPHLPGGAVEPGTGAAGADAPAGADAGAAAAVRGPIRSRDDVARALEEICVYYEQVEPGSPVPFLLRRAQKLAAMNFVQAMQELNLATLDALRPSMGSALEGAAPAEGTPPA